MLEYINVLLINYHIYIFLQIYFGLDQYYHNGERCLQLFQYFLGPLCM